MTERTSDTAVNPIFLERWSPRAFDGTEMPEADLETILEAGRWAPSAFNYQPWRFLHARRGDAHWDQFVSLLMPFNAAWAQNASALIFVVSDTLMRGDDKASPSHSHSFDAGAAWAQIALQAHMLGYHSHGMGGIEYAQITEQLGVPDGFRVEAGVALGRIADASTLPDKLRDREFPSDRKPLAEVAFCGGFQAV